MACHRTIEPPGAGGSFSDGDGRVRVIVISAVSNLDTVGPRGTFPDWAPKFVKIFSFVIEFCWQICAKIATFEKKLNFNKMYLLFARKCTISNFKKCR